MNNGFRLTPTMIDNLSDGYKSGKTTTQLSAEYSISKATICRALRKRGIEPERKDNLFQQKQLTPEEAESICVDYRAGLNISELCKKYHTYYETIVEPLEAANLYKRKVSKKFDILKEAKNIKVGENSTRKYLSADEAVEICEKYQDGPQTKLELSEEYDVHVDTITAVLNKAGVPTKNYLADETIDSLCEEFVTGDVTIGDLSKVYEKNPETIRYWLTKRGLIGTKEGAPPQITPSATTTAARIRQLARDECESSLKTLMEIRDNPMESGRTRGWAANAILERALGKPREEAEDDSNEGSTSLTSKVLKFVPKGLIKKKE